MPVTVSVNEYDQIIETADETTQYIGIASPGTATTESRWAIQKVTNDGTTSVSRWANGNANFDKTWSDRASYTYLP